MRLESRRSTVFTDTWEEALERSRMTNSGLNLLGLVEFSPHVVRRMNFLVSSSLEENISPEGRITNEIFGVLLSLMQR